ncbi:MAG: YaaC family protein [Cyanobacteria bacterium J06649_4]
MPEIIGPFSSASSAVPPLDAHVGHLRHLTNLKIAKDILRQRHRLSEAQARDTSKLLTSHVRQALDFHSESRSAALTTRPVLQYYSYLNLAVAAILAFRPTNYHQYRRHGVEDKTHTLTKLALSSTVLKVNRGAVPLFHSILSDVQLYNRRLRFGQLAAGFHMVNHELRMQFNKTTQSYVVTDEIKEDGGVWRSVFTFSELKNRVRARVPAKRLEDAMPLLASDYSRDLSNTDKTIYTSTTSWTTENKAAMVHRQHGLKLINYGGHHIASGLAGMTSI